jgi:hypothetical protein
VQRAVDMHFDQRIQTAILPATVKHPSSLFRRKRATAAATLVKSIYSISSRAFEKDHFAIFELLFRSVLKSKLTIGLIFFYKSFFYLTI